MVISSGVLLHVNKPLVKLLQISTSPEDVQSIEESDVIREIMEQLGRPAMKTADEPLISVHLQNGSELRLGYSILTHIDSNQSELEVIRLYKIEPTSRELELHEEFSKSQITESQKLHLFFRSVADASMHSSSLKDFGQRILQFILREFDFDIGSIRILEGSHLILVAHAGLTELELSRLSLSMDVSEERFLPVRIVRSGKPLISEDLQKDELIRHTVDPYGRLNTRSHISWPIVGSDGNIIALLNLGGHHPQKFSDEYISMFKSAISVFAVSIEHQIANQRFVSQKLRFETLFKESPLPAFIIQFDRTTIELEGMNERARIFLGLEKTESDTYKLEEILPFSIRVIRDDLRNLLSEDTFVEREINYELENGEGRFIKLYYSLISSDTALLFLSDLTHQKNIEGMLRKLNDALVEERNMFISGNVILFRSGPEIRGLPEYISPNCEAILGYSIEDWMSGEISYLDVIHPEDLPRVKSHLLECIEQGIDLLEHDPYRVFIRDGSLIWVDHHVVISYNEDGTVQNFTGYIIDSTERHKALESLSISEKNFRSLASNLPHALLVFNDSGLLYYNPQFSSLFHEYLQKITELGVDSFLTLFGREDGMSLDQIIVDAKNNGFDTLSHDFTFPSQNNQELWFNVIISHIDFEGTKSVQLLISDISDYKEIERVLETNNALLVSTIEAVSIGVLAIDLNNSILYINEYLKDLWDIKDKMSLRIDDIIERSTDVIENVDTLAEFFNLERCARDKIDHLQLIDGRILEISCNPLEGVEGSFGRNIFFRDVTDREMSLSIAEAMSDLGLMLGGTHEISETFNTFLKTAISVSNMDFGALYIYNEDTSELDITSFHGFESSEISDIQYFPYESLISQIVRNKENMYLKFEMNRFAEFAIHPESQPKSIAIVPLKFNDQIVAALIAGSYTEMDIPRRSQIALENIGHQIASAMSRVKFETTLRINEERYRSILQSLNDIVIIIDGDYRISDFYISEESIWYSNIVEALGCKLNEVMNKELYSQIIRLIEITQNTREACTEEIVFERGDEVYFFSINATPHQDGTSIVLVARDLTESRRALEQHRVQQIELELYASLLRHDLGHDLQNLMHYLEIIEMDYEAEGLTKETSASALQLIERMGKILNLFSEAEDQVEDHILDLLQDVSNQFMKAFNGLTIEIDCPDQLKRTRVISGRLLSMCFANLFRNSIQHVSGPVIINISIEKDEDGIVILVKDNGPGIDQAIRDRIFQKGISTRGGGMGLYLTRQVLKAYGGSIELLDSDVGALFKIILPILT